MLGQDWPKIYRLFQEAGPNVNLFKKPAMRGNQERLLELIAELEWDASFDYKNERSRKEHAAEDDGFRQISEMAAKLKALPGLDEIEVRDADIAPDRPGL
jgi:hypothetical protein